MFYNFPLRRYFDRYNIDYIQLRNIKVEFYKRWIKRRYRLVDILILNRGRDHTDVKTIVDWKFYGNGEFSIW